MKLELNLHVTYKRNGVTEAELCEILVYAAEHLADNGLLTGETAAEVIELTHEVKRLPASRNTQPAASNAVNHP